MSSEQTSQPTNRYAAFRLRFRALIYDSVVCSAFFLIGSIVVAIVFEHSVAGRVAAFVVMLFLILGYEPVMVARYGGTLGHRRSNIRIVRIENDEKLPFWRAAVRSLVKQLFGLFSFIFMFATSRAQGLHDLAAGARVILRDPRIAAAGDAYRPASVHDGQSATRFRRVMMILIYNFAFFALFAVTVAGFVSRLCIEENHCSGTEGSFLSIISGAWIVLAGLSIPLGWTGRLPGCRPNK